VYRRGHDIALPRGILIADTKLEFGRAPDGTLVLADEVLTSDSSRFWPAGPWQPGRPQHAFDKQVVRDWSRSLDWDRTAPGPAIPPDIVAATRQRYIQAYEQITGTAWPPPPDPGGYSVSGGAASAARIPPPTSPGPGAWA
jgi:phosphoribosylaminoimidazole-succinocarboxamide synthase